MNTLSTQSSIKFGLIICAGAACAVTAGPLTAAPPSEIEVTGILRDFYGWHPDFTIMPGTGAGHYAGSVDLTVDADQLPALAGGGGSGYKVATQWEDSGSHNIAPHMFLSGGAGGPVAVAMAPVIPGNWKGTMDSWDSAAGPYGAPNVGSFPGWDVGATMPAVTVPADLDAMASAGDVSLNGATISADLHCDTLMLANAIRIDGDVRILCDDALTTDKDSTISLMPGARLTMYLRKGGLFDNDGGINESTGDPSRLTIYNVGISQLKLDNKTQFYGRIISPSADLLLWNHADLYGSFTGRKLSFKNHADFHADQRSTTEICGTPAADVAGVAGVTGDGGISSASSFGEWFKDVPGTNIAVGYVLTLTWNAGGFYGISVPAWWPADGKLLGNEGDTHNENFTFAFRADFAFSECAGQYFTAGGSDGLWVFIDGQLVIDSGGIENGLDQRIDLDRLGLVDGQTYRLDFFSAERIGTTSRIKIQTNLLLDSDSYLPAITHAFD